jgi:hypothetical protein
MMSPPGVGRKYVRRGRWKRMFAFVFVNRTVLLFVLRVTFWSVRIARAVLGGGA